MLGATALSQVSISAQRDPVLSAAALAGAATVSAAPQMPLVGKATLAGSAAVSANPTNVALAALAAPMSRRVYAVEISVWALTDRVAA